MKPKTVRATHDLKGVTTLLISGWPGEHRVEWFKGKQVEIEAPERHPGERWTFKGPFGGVLYCQTNLDDPHQITANNPETGKPWSELVVRVPEASYADLVVEFEAA